MLDCGHMHDSVFSIRPAVVEDAAALSAFAERVFMETFAKDNTPEDMDIYLRSVFSLELQAQEIAEPDGLILLAFADANRLAGYAHLTRTEAPSSLSGTDSLELKRFYVAHEWHGRGVATTMMREVLEQAKRRGARTLWLGVWEHNARAIAFYRKVGFREFGSHPFVLGHDPQTDLLMSLDLT
jgi:ribosomal protein S18 acetylase RimI-like enzyme